MGFSQEDLNEIRDRNNIVDVISSYVNLKQKGGSHFGLCPFHNEKSPSFSVNSEKGVFRCFGCGASGNVYSFVMMKENINFVEAVRLLAERINYTLSENQNSADYEFIKKTKEILFEIHICAAKFFYKNLGESKTASTYLDDRLITSNLRTRFGLGYGGSSRDGLYKHLVHLGYSNEHILKSGLVLEGKNGSFFDRFYSRLMFPIFEPYGKIVGFGGRILEDNTNSAKYVNSPDTLIFNKSQNLYGINFARKSKNRTLILVEGYLDTISMHQAGFNQAIAALGTSFNKEHVSVIKKFADGVIILFDSDNAGVSASIKAIDFCLNGDLNVKLVTLKDAKDPDEFLQKFGNSKMTEALNASESHIAFKVKQLKTKYDLNKTDEKIAFTKEVIKILNSLENSIEKEAYAGEISEITDISKNAILNELNISQEKTPVFNNRDLKLNKDDKEGVIKAKKYLLHFLTLNKEIIDKIKPILPSEELDDEVYIKMLNLIYDNKNIEIANFCNYFESVEEHKKVMEVFHNDFSIYDDNIRALNDFILIIKRAFLESKIKEAILNNDIETLQKLNLSRKNVNKLYIN